MEQASQKKVSRLESLWIIDRATVGCLEGIGSLLLIVPVSAAAIVVGEPSSRTGTQTDRAEGLEKVQAEGQEATLEPALVLIPTMSGVHRSP